MRLSTVLTASPVHEGTDIRIADIHSLGQEQTIAHKHYLGRKQVPVELKIIFLCFKGSWELVFICQLKLSSHSPEEISLPSDISSYSTPATGL